MFADNDPVAAIEAAYRLDVDEAAWLRGITESVRFELDGVLGMTAYAYEMRGGEVDVGTFVTVGNPAFEAAARGMNTYGPASGHHRVYRGTWSFTTLSRLAAQAQDPEFTEVVERFTKPLGFADVAGLIARNPVGTGVMIAAPLARVTELLPEQVTRWSRVGAHVAAGMRLRGILGPPDGDAVLGPDGRCLHAEGAARSLAAREGLREAARRVDRARGALRRTDPDEAAGLWWPLVAGRWSLVDRVDADGRRFLVARRNDPETRVGPGLTWRERQVTAFAGFGHSNKLIAYTLGLSQSSVETHLRRAMRKLGVSSRATLAGQMADWPEPSRTSLSGHAGRAGLTPAERTVVELMVRGLSNREIGRVLGRSERTVANQLASSKRKLGGGSRYELAARFGLATAPVVRPD